jgi:hypothetical protein
LITNTVLTSQAGQYIRIYYSGGSAKVYTNFSVTGNDCVLSETSINGANAPLISARSATTCQVTASQSWRVDGAVKQIFSSPVGFTFYRLDPSPLVLSNFTIYPGTAPAPSSNTYPVGTWIKIATTGGDMIAGGPRHESAISYVASGAGCVMGTATLRGVNAFSATAPTTCVITATKNASEGYNAVTTAPLSYVFDNLDQLPLLISTPNTNQAPLGSSFPLSTVGGSGTGSVSYSVTGTNCQINVTYLIGSAATICSVIATKAASTGYKVTSSPPVDFVFALLDQEPLVISNPDEPRLSGNPILLTTTGGSGTGAVSFTAAGANCSLSKNYLTTNNWSDSALCVVTASKAASTGYKIVSSATKNFTFTKPIVPVDQAAISISNISLTNSYRAGGVVLTLAGGSGDGSITYTLKSEIRTVGRFLTDSTCRLNKDNSGSITILSSIVPAKCVITAKKSASTGFKEAVSAPVEFTFTPAEQVRPNLTFKVGSTGRGGVDGYPAVFEEIFLTVNGGTTLSYPDGNITYSVSGKDCYQVFEQTTSNRITGTSPTTCTITANKPGGAHASTPGCLDCTEYYLPVTTAPITVTFAMLDQKPLRVVNLNTTSTSFKTNEFVYLYAAGGSGSGNVRFNVSGSNCIINGFGDSGISLTSSTEATCQVTATKSVAAREGYNSPVTSPPVTYYFIRP